MSLIINPMAISAFPNRIDNGCGKRTDFSWITKCGDMSAVFSILAQLSAQKTAHLKAQIFKCRFTHRKLRRKHCSQEIGLVYRTCKFSQDFDEVLELMQTRARISLATCNVCRGLETRRAWIDEDLEFLDPVFFPLSPPDSRRSCLKRICLRIPTKSSSTLCWMQAEVSMNFTSKDLASRRPSMKMKMKQFVIRPSIPNMLVKGRFVNTLSFWIGLCLVSKPDEVLGWKTNEWVDNPLGQTYAITL